MDLDIKQLALAIRTIAEEKNLPEDVVKSIVEQALIAAYKRDFGDREQEVKANINLNNGDVDIYVSKVVVSTVEHPSFEISLKDASVMKKNIKLGEEIEIHEKVETFGRVAAQTAKQVMVQKLRETERDLILEEFEDKIGTIINANVARVENNLVRIDLGRIQGIMPKTEQIPGEHYYPGQRIKVYLKDVEKGFRGPQLLLSRSSSEFVSLLFRNEVPEMESGAVSIEAIAREAGVRTKLAVSSSIKGVDPVGTFVGGHGTRVNAVMSEIGDQEKIDIIVFDKDPKQFIINALSPTKVNNVVFEGTPERAIVLVDEDQQSIAIGKSGQNVRLASKLTGFEIDIKAEKVQVNEPESVDPNSTPQVKVETIKSGKLKKKSDLENNLLEAIEEHGE